MAQEIFLQNWIFTEFALPFLLIFFVVFAILEKTKVLGEDKKQLNALTAFIIGLIFIAFADYTLVVQNLILFLTVALIIVFVILLLWGFVSTGSKEGFELESWMKYSLWGVISIAVIIAVLWATGIQGGVIDLLFYQSWSGVFWTNILFVAAVAGALALILKDK
jgi:hypothetical protein